MFLMVDDHRLYYEVHGPASGPAVALLHHGLGSVRAWRAQIPALAGAGYRVVAYDRWGYGGSDPRPALDLPGFEADQEHLAALLDALHINRAALVGHSDGGTLALHYAARHAEQVRCLVAVAAHIYVEAKMIPGIRGVGQVYEADARFREGLRRIHGEKAESTFDNWFRGWQEPRNLTWDMRPELRTIACPALVVQGEQDEHATPWHARDIAAAIPGAELWLVPGANHELPQNLAEMFNERLLEFLQTRPS